MDSDDPQNIVPVVPIPSKEVGPHEPQEMVVSRFQEQDPDHVEWPISQEEKGPHLPENCV